MKKTASALFASTALVLGAGAIGSSATAAPYPSTVHTITAVTRSASVTEGKAFYTGTVVFAGNAVVNSGTVTVIFGGVKTVQPVVNGRSSFTLVAPLVKKTKFRTLKAYFKPAAGSIFLPSHGSSQIKVKNVS